ncbi:MAG: hypothetical protein IJL01_01540 [Synergistaceae bacterium]|nr:hypothetical protein [Synergistaceae bacterium]
MKFILAFMLVILNLNLNSYALAEHSNTDLMNMNLNSLSADFGHDKAYSTGAGRIISGQPNSLALARRAALSDARRGLLILKRELEEGRPRRPDDVSGHVPPVKILDEFESGDIYVIRVEAVLSELMHDSEEVNEEYEDEYEEHEYEDRCSSDVSSHDYDDFI